MTDLETMTGMLERAHIPYETKSASPNDDIPAEGTCLTIHSNPESGKIARQPNESGYRGFITEIVFDGEGNLWAVWAWE